MQRCPQSSFRQFTNVTLYQIFTQRLPLSRFAFNPLTASFILNQTNVRTSLRVQIGSPLSLRWTSLIASVEYTFHKLIKNWWPSTCKHLSSFWVTEETGCKKRESTYGVLCLSLKNYRCQENTHDVWIFHKRGTRPRVCCEWRIFCNYLNWRGNMRKSLICEITFGEKVRKNKQNLSETGWHYD